VSGHFVNGCALIAVMTSISSSPKVILLAVGIVMVISTAAIIDDLQMRGNLNKEAGEQRSASDTLNSVEESNEKLEARLDQIAVTDYINQQGSIVLASAGGISDAAEQRLFYCLRSTKDHDATDGQVKTDGLLAQCASSVPRAD
jgi:hypothetical protein